WPFEVGAKRDERLLDIASCARLTKPDVGHERVTQAEAPFGVLGVPSLAREGLLRLGWAAVAHGAIAMQKRHSEEPKVAEAGAFRDHVCVRQGTLKRGDLERETSGGGP